jgi:hypothetical protein
VIGLIVSAFLAQGSIGAAPAWALPGANTPASNFLAAADRNDFPTMESLIDRQVITLYGDHEILSPSQFLQTIANCYLGRVYGNAKSGETIAKWTCADGARLTRMVYATVANRNDKAMIVVARVVRKNEPTLPRLGSAFAQSERP